MAFIYEVKLNGNVIDEIELGITHIRDLEEALDSGSITLIVKDIDFPFEPNSLLTINIEEYKDFNSNVILNSKEIVTLVVSDNVEPMSQLVKYYRHKLTLIEYGAKFDNYLMNNLSFTNRSVERKKAKFFYYNTKDGYPNAYMVENSNTSSDNTLMISKKIHLDYIGDIFDNYLDGDVLKITKKNKAVYADTMVAPIRDLECDVFVRINDYSLPNRNVIISNQNVEWNLNVGKWEIEYGINIPFDEENENANPIGEFLLFKYYIEVLPKETNTMFEVIEQIRNTISKFGGIESKYFFEQTRLFKINDEDKEYLKSIQAPQVFLQNATVRQMLIFVLSYINALPKITKSKDIDILELEFYGDSFKGSNEEFENIIMFLGSQNNNQLGSRSYSAFKNILPNDLDEPTTFVPTQDGYQTVRAENIQLTDTSFELKLPKGKYIYKPIKLEVLIPLQYKYGSEIEKSVLKLDLTDALINKSEWELKEKSSNFPKAYFSKAFSSEVGFNKYQTENLYWQQGDESIKLSDVNGTFLKSNLILSVILHEINKYYTERPNPKMTYIPSSNMYVPNVTIIFNKSGDLWFKDLKFNFEYITSEEINLKQDKEDLSQINFYSEMRQNQDENTISLSRVSNKTYGNLQRTGNKNFSLRKIHTSFDGMYEIGQKDINGYVVTKIVSEYYNTHIYNTYFITKDHNRISQATFIDQTYRKFDNYAQQISNRHETYNDYVFLIPKDEKNLIDYTTTKFQENNLINGRKIPNQILFGVMGINIPNGQVGYQLIGKTKATVALVRTDGFLEEYKDESLNGDYVNKNFVVTPVTSAGFRQGVVFKFGFEDSQIAGDMLIARFNDNKTNYFNQALRYTNNRGRFNYLDFNVLNKIDTFDDELDKYPLKKSISDYASDTSAYTTGIISYFNTGKIEQNKMGLDHLIVYKDTMTNFNLSYALNILSYEYEKYIFGEKFYKNNHLVYNKHVEDKTYLYFYDIDFRYNIFENIKIKDGFIGNRILNDGYIEIDDDLDIFNNHPNANTHTWAIGDENGNLIFVNNGGGANIGVVKTHFRPNVYEIGYKPSDAKYIFDILDEQDLIVNNGVNIVVEVYMFDIVDEQELIINKGLNEIQEIYMFNILDEQELNISKVDTFLQLTYQFNILDEQELKVNSGVKYIQKTYDFGVIDEQELKVSVATSYIQKYYSLDILDIQEFSINGGTNFIQQSYDIVLIDNQELIVAFLPSPSQPTATPNASNYGQIIIGSDGKSLWECKRTSSQSLRWELTGEKVSSNVGYPTGTVGGSCSPRFARGVIPFPDFNGDYRTILCTNITTYSYYWELI